MYLRSILKPNDWHSFYQPIMPAFHMANIIQFILPKSATAQYADWLKATCQRLDVIAKVPDLEVPVYSEFQSEQAYDAYCAPRRGPPLPPVVLDPNVDLTNLDLAAESARFIATLDHTKNRYLKSPDEMLAEGFEGIPYGKVK
jgi:hypothetical protein